MGHPEKKLHNYLITDLSLVAEILTPILLHNPAISPTHLRQKPLLVVVAETLRRTEEIPAFLDMSAGSLEVVSVAHMNCQIWSVEFFLDDCLRRRPNFVRPNYVSGKGSTSLVLKNKCQSSVSSFQKSCPPVR